MYIVYFSLLEVYGQQQNVKWKPRLTLEITCSKKSDRVKSEANITPKYLHLFTLSNSQLKIDRDNEEILYNFLLLPIDMDLVFERLKVSLSAFSHNVTL